MTDRWRARLGERWRRSLRAAGRSGPLERLARVDRDQWQALAAWRGLTHQAFAARPLAPRVCSDLWERGAFHSSADRRAFFSPGERELEPSSHHYGHDVQLKRHAGLPLIGPPLPWLLEHGLKVSATATFERPQPWARGYLCMGPLRAGWLRERFGQPAVPIGPWIHYARPLLPAEELRQLREELGSTLLVVLAHSWDQVERRMDVDDCVAAVAATAREIDDTDPIDNGCLAHSPLVIRSVAIFLTSLANNHHLYLNRKRSGKSVAAPDFSCQPRD